jgi:hypothetical protein
MEIIGFLFLINFNPGVITCLAMYCTGLVFQANIHFRMHMPKEFNFILK